MVELGLGGRAAVVTGASKGIGRAIAGALAAEGAHVLLVARGAEALDEAVDEILVANGTAVGLVADVTDPGAAAVIVERCLAEFGRLDILVNNAGGSAPKQLTDLTDDDWWADLELNFVSAARLAVACAPVMREAGWGRMIHIGSTSGSRPDALFAPYSAAKAALTNLSVSLSVELSGDGVLSNVVVAGITETELVQENAAASAERAGRTTDEVMARMLSRTDPPTGRFGTPDEIATAVVFLASEQSSWITGSTLTVDGGTLRGV
ncbi:MAG: short-chain dehydrogenase/reductase [Acidimicrobiales bacterium]|nr:short-chain dehydrogenase/reductase [Acidimicrobiales bacterium]